MKSQEGMILIPALLSIIVLMLISSIAFETLYLNVKQIHAYKQQNAVFGLAEQTLNTAVIAMASLTQEPNEAAACVSKLCIFPLLPTRNFFDLAMWQQVTPNIGNAELQQYVLIEWLERDPQLNKTVLDNFQITVMGYNTRNHARRILQAVVSKTFDSKGKAIDNKVFVQTWRVMS